jgi:hypothetical protein
MVLVHHTLGHDRQVRGDVQQTFLFAPTRDDEGRSTAESLGDSPRVGWTAAPQTLGENPRVGCPPGAEISGALPLIDRPSLTESVGDYPRVSAGASSSAVATLSEHSARASVDEAKIMVLRGFAALQHVDASNETLAVIARHVEEPEELFGALIFTIALASVEHTSISPALAEAAMSRRAGGPAEPSDNIRGCDWAAKRVLELARRVEPHTTSVQAGSMSNEFYSRCVVHACGDAAEASAILQRILTDPRICGGPGIEAPLKPLALLRDGFQKGWIWTEAHEDDGSTALGRAYARLNPGDQHEVERIFRSETEGAPLDVARLRRHQVTSRQMIGYLRRRFKNARSGTA